MIDSRILIDTIGLFIEMIIAYNYMEALLKRCKVDKKTKIISYFIAMAFIFITIMYYENTIIFPIMFIIAYFIMLMTISTLYEGELLIKIISSLLLIIFFISSEVIVIAITIALTRENMQFIFSNKFYYSQIILSSKVLVWVLLKPYKYRRRNAYFFDDGKIRLPLISIPILSIVVIYVITTMLIMDISSYTILLVILITSLLIVTNIFIFYLFEKYLKHEEQNVKIEIFKQQFKKQKLHFEELTENQRRTNKVIHDTKNQLLSILGYIENNEKDLAIEGLNSLCHNMVKKQNFINTGNIAVDSLLNIKINKIKELNIELETSIFLEKHNEIEEIEMCIVLGNLLDNSIEACEKISTEYERTIQLKIIQVEEYLSIYIKNSTLDGIKLEEDKIQTTKADKLFHGFGLENINEIVDKYNGYMDYEQIENTFIVKVLLQNSMTSPAS